VSVKVPEELRKLMRSVNVNWSEYLRELIETKAKEEMARDAVKKLDEIRERAGKLPTEELLKWIREDRSRSLK
jgi:hypothetical protein